MHDQKMMFVCLQNDLSRNDDDEDDEGERAGDEEAGTSHKRTLSASPSEAKGGDYSKSQAKCELIIARS